MKAKFDRFIFWPIIAFSCLYLPFLNIIPYLDGNIDFVQSYHFFSGGFDNYFRNWSSVHPPIKIILSAIFFKIFGVNPISYNLVGYLVGISAIWACYRLTYQLFNQQSAKIASLMLVTSPLFLSTGIFSLRDYLLTCFILLAFYFYSIGSYFNYLVFSALLFLSKESGLLLIICVIFIEIIGFIRNRKFIKLFLSCLGLIAPLFWWHYLSLNHKKPWGDWIFAETASKGTYYTMVRNILDLKIFNQYAHQHWLHLFVLNFNWFFWLIIVIGAGLTVIRFRKKSLSWSSILNLNQKRKTILVIFIFSVGYFFTVLSFQTYTIPRYILPLMPFLYIAVSFFISKLIKGNKIIGYGTILTVITIIVLSGFFSFDPISQKIWGKINILGQPFYGLNEHLSGNDGITYNFQYLYLIKRRTSLIMEANKQGHPIKSGECYWLFPDPRNDNQTLKILGLKSLFSTACEDTLI